MIQRNVKHAFPMFIPSNSGRVQNKRFTCRSEPRQFVCPRLTLDRPHFAREGVSEWVRESEGEGAARIKERQKSVGSRSIACRARASHSGVSNVSFGPIKYVYCSGTHSTCCCRAPVACSSLRNCFTGV